MRYYTADFETTTDENDCRVWGYGIYEIGADKFECGNNIDDFMDFWQSSKEPCKVYIHNLRFDGFFIINWLTAHNFRFVKDKTLATDRSYTCLITKDNIYYNIEIWFERDKDKHLANKVKFYDSMKILNAPVEKIANDFKLPIKKGTINYKEYRPIGHKLTAEEIGYIRNDVEIVGLALDALFKAGIKQSTIGTSAMDYFLEMQPNYNRQRFPQLGNEIDSEVRRAYCGGFCYLNPIYKEKEINNALALDCNSEYPAMMASKPYPMGKPKIFYGEYKPDVAYPLYIISFSCSFELKKNKIPTIRIKDSPYYDPQEYIESSNGMIEKFIMSSVDYKLFRDHYDVEDIRFNGGYKFKAYNGLFTPYIEHWNKLKIDSKINSNASMYQISKKMMNALYGKFAIKTDNNLKAPKKMDDGIIHMVNYKKDDRRGSYTPIALFTTAYGRDYLIRTAQKIRDWSLEKYGEDYYIYSDTDSIKIKLNNKADDLAELRQIIDIHKYKLGSWKIETEIKRAKFIHPKCYIQEDYNNKLDVVISGFPRNLTPVINFDNFKKGFSTANMTMAEMVALARKNGATDEQIARMNYNLKYKYVKGGIVLKESQFTLK